MEGDPLAMSSDPQPAAPVLVAFEGPAPQKRVTVFFRLILLIPQLIVLEFVAIAAAVVIFIGWFGALFTGRLPDFAAQFLTGYVRWQARVLAYAFLLTDKYPPFSLENDDSFPVWVTAQPGPLNRAAVFFRIILIIPAYLVVAIVTYGSITIVAFITWLIVLFTGQMPRSAFEAYAAVVRYQVRVYGYLSMITSVYPGGLFGDAPLPGGAAPTPDFGAYGAPAVPGAPTYGAPGATVPPFGQPQPEPQPFGQAQPQGSGQPWGVPESPTPSVPTAPTLPGVAFTFGGPSYLWGYTDDRSHCGIWSVVDLHAPPQTWPIGEQGEAWTRFWELEPNAVELKEPTPPPAAAWSPAGPAPAGAATFPYGGPSAPTASSPYAVPGSPYGTGPATYPLGPVAAGSPVDDPRWRLVLGQGAKNLIVAFLILGVLTAGLYVGIVVTTSNPLQKFAARVQVEAAYTTLNTAVTNYESATNACRSSSQVLTCVTGTDRTVGQAFGTFVSALDGISEPSGATAAAAAVASDGRSTERVFQQLAAATSVSQYEQAVQSSNLTQVLTQFQDDYDQLLRQLG